MTAPVARVSASRALHTGRDALHPAAFAGWIDLLALEPGVEVVWHEFDHEIALAAPGLDLRFDRRRLAWHATPSTVTLVLGCPLIDERAIDAEQAARALAEQRDDPWQRIGGRYALLHLDLKAGEVLLATDRFAVWPLAWSRKGQRIAFSDRADRVPAADDADLDPQALFDYVYFHVIPAPGTVFRGVQRVEPATALRLTSLGTAQQPTWRPSFEAPSFMRPSHEDFLAVVRAAVLAEADGAVTGCFLSGGTDSSTVAGMLARERGRVKTFSIGFDADGYDEMAYARIAARHFGTDHHEYYVTPDDLVKAVPMVAGHYDQPFGNSSAVPAYICARIAGHGGVERILAGDGGDELFGGNLRYAKQKVFEAYWSVPSALRSAVEPLLLNKAARAVPGIAKVASYVAQARVPMPARMETYNLLRRFGAHTVFPARFLERVNATAPDGLQREVYAQSAGAPFIDRMLAYDWRFTLSDNDLPKVTGTTQLAGIEARFPLLADAVVDLSLRLGARDKVRGLKLRHFFKEALAGFLPPEIVAKKKHGFGLPVGPWLVTHAGFRALAYEALHALAERGVVEESLVADLFSRRLEEHPGYYGEMVWVLMMVEYWMRSHAPSWSCR